MSCSFENMQLRNYLHGITYEEYAKNAYAEAIPNEMWAKSETHMMKLIEEEKKIEKMKQTTRSMAYKSLHIHFSCLQNTCVMLENC